MPNLIDVWDAIVSSHDDCAFVTTVVWIEEEARNKVTESVKEEETPISLRHCFEIVKDVVDDVHPHETQVIEHIYVELVGFCEKFLEV